MHPAPVPSTLACPKARPAVLSPPQIGRVHEVALDILARGGICLKYGPSRELLRAQGAAVDETRHRVRIPRALVEQALTSAPRAVTLCSRSDPSRDCHLGPEGGQYGRPVSGLNWIIDAGALTRRPVTETDALTWNRLAHGLPNLHVVSAAYDQEGPPHSMDVRSVARMLQSTDKPLMLSALSGEGMRWVKRLTDVTQPTGRHPRVMVLSSVNSPLTYSSGQTEAAMYSAELGIPVAVNSSVVAGASAPVTIAGALAQMHAEMLAALTILQVHRPGAPIIYSGHPLILDMRSSLASVGFTEIGLLQAACIDLGYHLGLPTGSNGLTTDTCTPDAMAASEKWSSGFLPALAGANINAGAGSLACLSTISLEQLAIDDDIYGRLFRQLRGFTLDEETLAAEVIARAGYDASFLGDDHTLAHCRSEYSYSALATRENAALWEGTGSKEVVQRAAAQVQTLLSDWQPVVSEAQGRELSGVLARAEKALEAMELPV